MIHNIVFDMGGVLIHFRPTELLARLGVPEEDRPFMVQEVFVTPEWTQTDRGTLLPEEAADILCPRLPERLRYAAREVIVNWWKGPLSPMEGMGELIEELHTLGYHIFLLSNANTTLHEHFSRIPGSSFFEGRIVSADWKQLKPEREIYQTLFREYALRPEECFFVDDLPINIEAARFAGMDGAVFRGDVARLRRELNAAGVRVKEVGHGAV